MKNIIIIIIASFVSLSCKSQTINIKDWDGTPSNGAYYKDIDNELNQFEGTYRYINGNDELTMVFKKHVNFYAPPYSEDLLTGEIKYKKDGVVLFDNLSKINDNLENKYLHDICGNSLISNTTRPECDDCQLNQFRARLIFFGISNNNVGGSVYLQKFMESGQEKIKVLFLYRSQSYMEGQDVPTPLIPWGYYTLTKI
ncbi:DUF6705 family protein [Flavobacterium sp.]